MSVFDLTLLAAVLAVAAWAVATPARTARWRTACLALVVVGFAQLGLEGFYWQFLPTYGLLAAVSFLPLTGGRVWRGLVVTALAVLGLGAVLPWMLLPVPRLPPPTGAYAVGSEVFRWVDTRRLEPVTADLSDYRNVVAQAWYPSAPVARGGQATYLDGLGQLPDNISGVPRFIFRHFDKMDTHATLGASISNARASWPVVVFSPGYGAPRGFYTGLLTQLASRGYIVLALDHPYEAGVTQLANGRVVGHQQAAGRPDAQRSHYMEDQVEVRVADVSFALDQIARPGGVSSQLARRADPRRIAAIGHSFGGATALLAMERDRRITAAADIDGFLWGAFSGQPPRGPVLILESDHPDTPGSRAFIARTLAVLGHAPRGGYRYRLEGTHHFSFTDAPLFFSPPGQFVLGRVLGGPRGVVETHRATADILSEFLSEPLTGKAGGVAAVVGRYGGISGGSLGVDSETGDREVSRNGKPGHILFRIVASGS